MSPAPATDAVSQSPATGRLWMPVVIALVSVAAYLPAIQGAFVFDDYPEVVRNLDIQNDVWTALAKNPFRPLTYLSFWALFHIGGFNPVIYHAANLLVHAVCVVTLWDIVRRSGYGSARDKQATLVAVAVAAVHPLASESVAGVAGHAMLGATAFALLSMRSVMRSLTPGKGWHHELALGLFALSLLTKESNAALPLVIIFFLVWGPPGLSTRAAIRRAAPFFLLAGAAAFARFLYPLEFGLYKSGLTPERYFLTQPWAIPQYWLKFLLPLHQSIEYNIPIIFDSGDVRLWCGVGVVGSAVAYVYLRRTREAAWWIGWILAALLPIMVIPLSDVLRENRAYLAVFGFAGLCGAGLHWLRTHHASRLIPVAVAVCIACLMTLTVRRAYVWGDDTGLRIWKDAVRVSWNKARPLYNYGVILWDAGRPNAARRAFGEAARSDPDMYQAHNNIGMSYADAGEYEQALPHFRNAVLAEPAFVDGHINLAVAARQTGRLTEARAHLARAEILAPGDPRVEALRRLLAPPTAH